MKHSAAIVTNWDTKALDVAHKKAKEIYAAKFKSDIMNRDASSLVSDIVHGITNSQASFFIAPDGSKEGWSDSNNSNEARTEFLDWLLKNDNFSDYIEVYFGGDSDHSTIIRTKDTDLDNLE